MEILNLSQYVGKVDGQEIHASTWNDVFGDIQDKINEIIAGMGSGSTIPTPNPDQDDVNQDNPETEFSLKDSEGNYYGRTNGVVTLPAGGYYELKGTVNGRIVVDATGDTAPEKDTVIRLKGCYITTANSSAITYNIKSGGKKYKKLIVELDQNSENIIICSGTNTNTNGENGAINSQNNLVIQGVGYLAIKTNLGHGVRADELTIAGPHIWMSASHDGFHAASNLTIADGAFHFESAKDWFGTGSEGTIDVISANIDENSFSPSLNYFDCKVVGTYSEYGNVEKYNNVGTLLVLSSTPVTNDNVGYFLEDPNREDGWYIKVADLLDLLHRGAHYLKQDSDSTHYFNPTAHDPGDSAKIVIYRYDEFSVGNDKYSHLEDATYSSFTLQNYDDLVQNLDTLPTLMEAVNSAQSTPLGEDDYYMILVKPASSTPYPIVYTAQTMISTRDKNATAGVVKQYDTKEDLTDDTNGEIVTAVSTKYNITKPFVKVSGLISNKSIFVDSQFEINGDSDVTVYLYNTRFYNVVNYTEGAINFMPENGKIKIISKEGMNVIYTTKMDCIKSENNISIEIKQGSSLILKSKLDGIDGGTVKITDSEGTLWVNADQNGVKGNCIIIGPNANVTSSQPVAVLEGDNITDNNGYYANSTDAPDEYSEFKGAAIIYGGDPLSMIVTGGPGEQTIVSGGVADIFARQGKKATKGFFGTLDAALSGVIITGSIGATKKIDLGNARNLYCTQILTTAHQSVGENGPSYNSIINHSITLCNMYKDFIDVYGSKDNIQMSRSGRVSDDSADAVTEEDTPLATIISFSSRPNKIPGRA